MEGEGILRLESLEIGWKGEFWRCGGVALGEDMWSDCWTIGPKAELSVFCEF
jgi:hypothetical protein